MVKSKVSNIQDKQLEKEFPGFIYKIQIDKKTDIPNIEYVMNNDKNEKTISLKGKEKPLASFLKAMQDLSEIFCEICEIEDKTDETLVTTVNFSEKGGVIISGQVNLTKNGIPQPLCMNTPHVLIEYNEKSYNLPEYAQKQIKELKKQAILYIKGEVAEKQNGLFDEEAVN